MQKSRAAAGERAGLARVLCLALLGAVEHGPGDDGVHVLCALHQRRHVLRAAGRKARSASLRAGRESEAQAQGEARGEEERERERTHVEHFVGRRLARRPDVGDDAERRQARDRQARRCERGLARGRVEVEPAGDLCLCGTVAVAVRAGAGVSGRLAGARRVPRQQRQERGRTEPTPTTRPIISTSPPTPASAAPATVVPALTTPSAPSDSSTSRNTSSCDFGSRCRRRAGMSDWARSADGRAGSVSCARGSEGEASKGEGTSVRGVRVARVERDEGTHPEREPSRVRRERRVLDLDIERALGRVRRRARARAVAGARRSSWGGGVEGQQEGEGGVTTRGRDGHGAGDLGVLHLDVGRAVGLADEARLEDWARARVGQRGRCARRGLVSSTSELGVKVPRRLLLLLLPLGA